MPNVRLAIADARFFPRDRAALAAALGAASPDVAIVHGSPHLGRWRSLSAAIARQAGLVVVGGGRVGGANLIMSSLAVDFVSVSDVLFGHNPARPAGISVARLRRGGALFAVGAASLGSAAGTGADTVRHELAGVADLPFVLSVDGDVSQLADLGQIVADRVVVSRSIEVDAVEARQHVLVADLTLPLSG